MNLLNPLKHGDFRIEKGVYEDEEYKQMLAQMNDLNELIQLRAEKQFEKFGFKEVKIDTSKLKQLGKGNFGAVYLYVDVNGKEHVLKTVDIEKMLTEEDKK